MIGKSKNYKYLGTIISNNGSFKMNEINQKKKGLRASYLIMRNIGLYSNVSTALSIYEKTVEPILTYNSEVAMAFISKSWSYKKFANKMWNHAQEINKTNISVIRQLLGVHKKSSNMAVLGETGKHPICMKIYINLMKYYLRLVNSNNVLLQEALETNKRLFQRKKDSWMKIIHFLLKVTDLYGAKLPTSNQEQDCFIKMFKEKLNFCFETWWKNEINTSPKLDFYSSLKKHFRFESYLDNLDRDIRLNVTRLRISSHCLPVEVLRYQKKKLERAERMCDICNTPGIGDEKHYLSDCSNRKIREIRKNFHAEITPKVPQLIHFSSYEFMKYCLTMADETIQIHTGIFVKKLLRTYKEEKTVPPLYKLCTKALSKMNVDTSELLG